MKPMLAGKCEDISALRYPLLASPKLDGVRALVIDGVVVSRQLKPIPNKWVQEQFGQLPTGTDGELIFGDPTLPDAYRNTVSAVMSEDGEPMQVRFHVFDDFEVSGGFKHRYSVVENSLCFVPGMQIVPHTLINNAAELEHFEADMVDRGFEGVMIRSLDGPYKQGRSTTKEGYLLKLKRFEDAEAIVVDIEERMRNDNIAVTNLLGHTARSSHKENLVGHGDLGALIVNGVGGTYDGVEFSIGTGFQGQERIDLWKIREKLVGKTVKFKYFPSGSKDRPRFPVFLGWRSLIDF